MALDLTLPVTYPYPRSVSAWRGLASLCLLKGQGCRHGLPELTPCHKTANGAAQLSRYQAKCWVYQRKVCKGQQGFCHGEPGIVSVLLVGPGPACLHRYDENIILHMLGAACIKYGVVRCVRECSHGKPEVVDVLFVGEAGPSPLHAVSIDVRIDEATIMPMLGFARARCDEEGCTHREPEVVSVLLVGEPGPSSLHAVAIDGCVDEAGIELQRLVRLAADRSELSHHDAIQRVRQLLESPVREVPACNSRY